MEIISFRFQDFLSAFIILFAVIDITGLTPIIIYMKQKGQNTTQPIQSPQRQQSRKRAGAGNQRENDRYDRCRPLGPVIPENLHPEQHLYGHHEDNQRAGSFTTLLSLRALYGLGSILAALFLNILVIYVVIRNVHILERALGKTGVYVLRKFFGIILLALSVRMFLQNLSIALESF